MDSVRALAARINPAQTVLLLGAGASVPSGAPTGAEFAAYLARRLSPQPQGSDLSEIATIFEHRTSRRELVEAIQERLRNLEPTGGLLLLPEFEWRSIYSTNYDLLLEKAYRKSDRSLAVVRSNYDWQKGLGGTVLYKIHGCMTQDIGLGNKHRMVITDRDYDQVKDYHQLLFTSLAAEMLTCDTLVIGQSLADAHLKELAKKAATLNQSAGTPGRVYLLVYESDPDRAVLFEQYGIDVTSGSLETLLHAISEVHVPASKKSEEDEAADRDARELPLALRACTVDCSHSAGLRPDARTLFNGGAASYGDIATGFTIERAIENRLLDSQQNARMLATVLTGSAGVGKTTLARRLMSNRLRQDFICWEHVNTFQLNVEAWMKVEERLRASQRQAFLLVDDATEQLVAINRLADALGKLERPHLRLVLTANSAQWQSRRKSPVLLQRSHVETMSSLTPLDIDRFVNLVEQQQPIRELVEESFLAFTHAQRIRHLRDRCNADMYVCLKNIFGFEELDDILLAEYKDLPEDPQDIYRYVCAIQAMGGKVHRQLIVRLLGIDAGQLMAHLKQLEGIVQEHDISVSRGIYGWSTRHDVIATVIATYKFGDPDEQGELLENLIHGLNPSVWIEMETANALATSEMGIDRLPSHEEQIRLLTELVRVVPSERTPHRRLIRKYLNAEDTIGAKQAIEASLRDLGQDDIVDRYRVRLIVLRAEKSTGLMLGDRVSLLFEARSQASKLLLRRPDDRHNYRLLCEVGLSLMRLNGNTMVLSEGIDAFRKAESEIPDPEFTNDRKHYEQLLRTAGLG
ncbi:SIR2 family protein [Nocardioides lianchengensis]|uniref:SIR2-like domain-containing protein n=1 Tax=Nocardioides lianchengensis TaxID=1045774 RepID=A0A1G6ZWC4_9ACTN|nr:SIR2 family protein [Nocardioides lianchengensis]NYG12262.1 hypothetical protein [Nocardioides lianchengensis]SDE07014.1 SIR2-like domain-containing protein [Nocardioides lianchengensis]